MSTFLSNWYRYDNGIKWYFKPFKKKVKNLETRSPYLSPTPPPSPIHGHPDRNILCISDVFTRDTIQTSVDGGGFFQTDDIGQGGGGGQKVSFC